MLSNHHQIYILNFVLLKNYIKELDDNEKN